MTDRTGYVLDICISLTHAGWLALLPVITYVVRLENQKVGGGLPGCRRGWMGGLADYWLGWTGLTFKTFVRKSRLRSVSVLLSAVFFLPLFFFLRSFDNTSSKSRRGSGGMAVTNAGAGDITRRGDLWCLQDVKSSHPCLSGVPCRSQREGERDDQTKASPGLPWHRSML